MPTGMNSSLSAMSSTRSSMNWLPSGIHGCRSGTHCTGSGIHGFPSRIHSTESGIHSTPGRINSTPSRIHCMRSGINSTSTAIASLHAPMDTRGSGVEPVLVAVDGCRRALGAGQFAASTRVRATNCRSRSSLSGQLHDAGWTGTIDQSLVTGGVETSSGLRFQHRVIATTAPGPLVHHR